MELWIRTQSRNGLYKVDELYISFRDERYNCEHVLKYGNVWLGQYKDYERALEVLDEIQKAIQINAGFELYSNLGNFANEFNEKHNFVPVFQMPKD